MPPFIFPALQLIWSFILSALESRIGQILVAFCVAWLWSGWDSDSKWKAKIAAQNAEIERKYQEELHRQEEASRELAAEATLRAEQEESLRKDLQNIIDGFKNKEPNSDQSKIIYKKIPGDNCVIDGNFIDVVRQLSKAANSAKSTRGSRKIR